VTAPQSGPGNSAIEPRWCSPVTARRFDTTVAIRPEETRAIEELGVRNLRRLQYHDPSAPGWRVIGRLLRPLEAVNASLDSPPTPHRRRAMLDVIAVLLVRCAEVGRTFWGWTTQEWIGLLGHDQTEFRRNAPAWAGDEVRPLPRRARLSCQLLHRVPPVGQLPTADVVVADLRTRPCERRNRTSPHGPG
jgi:hypothetical protein